MRLNSVEYYYSLYSIAHRSVHPKKDRLEIYFFGFLTRIVHYLSSNLGRIFNKIRRLSRVL